MRYNLLWMVFEKIFKRDELDEMAALKKDRTCLLVNIFLDDFPRLH
jgi:hypothetical protein